ncbi:MAG: exodeoxyribonuclease V subunit gamma [Actinomycetota bacterium]|nr:exodeoxyribonuclease V subunit gamma [Actinomycetota bacterium]
MLHVVAADRARPLAAYLAGVLAEAPDDPLSPEWVAVPSAGMGRWLALELAHHLGAGAGRSDGVAANIEFRFPGSLRERVLAAGRTAGTDDPWQLERLVWCILEVVDARPDDPQLTFLAHPPPGASRFGLARRVADLFDRYHLHRPDMIRAWAAERPVDGTATRLAGHLRWQPHLWRLCRQRLGVPSPAERLSDLLPQLRDGQLDVDLPHRLALFGLSQLPGGSGFVELAGALATRHDVHLLLLEPSTAVRRRVGGLADPARTGTRQRADDDSAPVIRHPLLRSWGRPHRETAVLLGDAAASGLVHVLELDTGRAADDPDGGRDDAGGSLLARLQADVRADRAPDGSFAPDRGDESIRIHACHGTTRQVEVLRDAILHLVADPELDLTEDDIIVLCPDLEQVAPIVEGVFGRSVGPGDGPRSATTESVGTGGLEPPALRYRIADRSIAADNPVVTATSQLLDLVDSRCDAAAVLDLAASAPVRRTFGFDDDDLARLADWVAATGVRWGIDAEHRTGFGVPAGLRAGTWRAGLDRALAGMAVRGGVVDLAAGGIAPIATDPGDIELAGRAARLVDVVEELERAIHVPRPVAEWAQLIGRRAEDLFTPDPDAPWQLDQLRRVLASVVDNASSTGTTSQVPLTFADLRRILDYELRAAAGRPDFFRGGITVTSMTPLRGVPFRVVCVVGMDDGALPGSAAEGDDLMASAPRLGDRDPRADARHALLDAVLAAGDRLLLFRTGVDIRTNQTVPVTPVVAELMDVLSAMVPEDRRSQLRRGLEIAHPRQAFDAACFEPGALAAGAWSFDPGLLAAAEARRHRRPSSRAFLAAPLPSPAPTDVDLGDLHGFLRHPVRTFLDQRLQITLPRPEDQPESILPLALGGLESWHLGDALLTALRAGRSTGEWTEFETRAGRLPPGALGAGDVVRISGRAEELVVRAAGLGASDVPADAVSVAVVLGDGTRVTGTVTCELAAPGPGPLRLTYSRLKPSLRLAAWLDLMALSAFEPETTWRSAVVARNAVTTDTAPATAVAELVAAGPDPASRTASALAALEAVVALYRRGLCEPLPLFATLSPALADGTAARNLWTHREKRGDGDDPANRVVYGGLEYDELLALPAMDGDPPGHGGRVARFADHLWGLVATTSIDRAAGVRP